MKATRFAGEQIIAVLRQAKRQYRPPFGMICRYRPLESASIQGWSEGLALRTWLSVNFMVSPEIAVPIP